MRKRRTETLLRAAPLAWLACTAAPPKPREPAPPPTYVASAIPTTPCARARALRELARTRAAEGRLERTVRTIRAADRLCPPEAPLTWPLLLTTLVDEGRYADARALVAIIDADPGAAADARLAAIEAKARLPDLERPSLPTARLEADKRLVAARQHADAGLHDKARASFLEAWKLYRPNGPALLGAALGSQALGDKVEARRCFDRAAVDFERGLGLALELEVPNGFGGFVEALDYGVSRVPGLLGTSGSNVMNVSDPVLAVAHRAQVSVLDATTLRERLRLRGHEGTVIAARILSDGLTLLSASRDGTARTWDLRTGKELRRFSGHVGPLNALALSEGEGVLATVGADGAARLYDRQSGTTLSVLSHGVPARAAAFSPGGTELAVATDDGRVVVWDWMAQTKLLTVTGHKGPVRAVALVGPLLYTAGDDDTVRAFDRKTGAQKHLGTGHSGAVVALVVSRDGKRVASASLDQTVRTWSRELSPQRVLYGHTAMALSLAFSADGASLASGDFDTVHVWDASTGAERTRVERHTHTVSALAFLPTAGAALAVGAADGSVRTWATSGLLRYVGHASTVTALAADPAGAWLVSGGLDSKLRRWSASPFQPAALAEAVAGSVQAISVSPDGKTIAVATPDKSLRRFDLALETHDDGKGPGAYGVAWSKDGKRVAFAAIGKAVVVRDATTFAEVMRLTGHTASVTAVAWSSDGGTIASASTDKTVRLWDAKTGALVATLAHPEPAQSLAFRPVVSGDGPWIATGAADGAVRLFSGTTHKEIIKIAAHTDAVTSLAISPDGRFLASGGKDGSAHLFGLPEGQLRLTLRGVSSSDAGYAFAPSGEFVGFGDVREFPVCRLGTLAVRYELCEDRFATDDLLSLLSVNPT